MWKKEPLLSQSKDDTKYQEHKDYNLDGMDDDSHPSAPEELSRKGKKENPHDDTRKYHPWLVPVVSSKEHTICYPVPLAEPSIHLG